MNFNDLTGRKFGRLTVVARAENSKSKKIRWECICECGNEKIAIGAELTKGNTKSCGCLRKEIASKNRFVDLTGQRFGRLIALEVVGINKNSNYRWLCQCDCGNTVTVDAGSLHKGNTKSCGCLKEAIDKVRLRTHGLSGSDLYNVWRSMKQRCNNPSDKAYVNYGGRGITVCQEWQDDYRTFYKWSMSHGYEKGLTIDRINNDGNYEPLNCRWTTYKVQANNKRNTKKEDLI